MDTTLRELRRRAAQTGSIEDRAALLRARVRAGDLTQEMLDLAARVGDRGARAALAEPLEDPINPLTGRHHGLATWIRFDLEPFGPEALIRAAIAAAWEVVRCRRPGDRRETVIRTALGAARAWVDQPTTEKAREAERLGPGTCGPRLRWCTSIGQAIAAYDQARRTHSLRTGLDQVGNDFAIEAIEDASEACGGELGVDEAGEAHVRDAIREALTEWALGAARA